MTALQTLEDAHDRMIRIAVDWLDQTPDDAVDLLTDDELLFSWRSFCAVEVMKEVEALDVVHRALEARYG